MRYDATGCSVPPDKEPVELCEASSPIHAGRNELHRPNEKTGEPPTRRHLIDVLGRNLNKLATSRARKMRVSFSNCAIRLIFVHLNRRRFRLRSPEGNLDCLEQSKISVKRLGVPHLCVPRYRETSATQIILRCNLICHATYRANAPALTLASASFDWTPFR
jgi:hypothetical protein